MEGLGQARGCQRAGAGGDRRGTTEATGSGVGVALRDARGARWGEGMSGFALDTRRVKG